MKLKTITHEQVCPYCGCKDITKIIHYDGVVSGTDVVCANCGKTYELSKTYDEESSRGRLIEVINNWQENNEYKAELKKLFDKLSEENK